jgi:hypothetical protein
VDEVPRGLRWREDGSVSARLRPRVSRLCFALFAAVWNLGLGPGHVLEALGATHLRRPPYFEKVGLLAGVFFLLLAVRELALETHVTFDRGQLVVRAPLAPWVRLTAPMSEIVAFDVVDEADGTHHVAAKMRTGPDLRIPLPYETVPLKMSGSRKRLFAAPRDYAVFVAVRLKEMLEAARRGEQGSYRG